MQVELDISPSFLQPCSLLFLPSHPLVFSTHSLEVAGHSRIPGHSWSLEVSPSFSDTLQLMTQQVVDEAREDKRLILDGVSLAARYKVAGVTREHHFRCPEENSTELALVLCILDELNRVANDERLISYLELLEGYFQAERIGKIFAENPLRLRIYGNLSTSEQKELEALIGEVAGQPALVLDLRNFKGMGTALLPCFAPLKAIPKLRIWGQVSALNYMKMAGFDPEIMESHT